MKVKIETDRRRYEHDIRCAIENGVRDTKYIL